MDIRTRAIRHMYRTNYAQFIGLAARAVAPNRQYIHHWMIELVADALEACRRRDVTRCVINLPPRSLKSISTSVAFSAWILAHESRAKILCLSGHRELYTTHHEHTAELMTHSKFRAIFPHITTTIRGRVIKTGHGGSRTAMALTSGITGKGADFIIIDDPLPASATHDVKLCREVNRWYDENIYQRLDEKARGVIIVVMQRLHVEDLTAHLLAQSGWHHIRIPAIAEQDEVYPLFGDRVMRQKGEALQPLVESRDQLKAAMFRMGAKAFMSQYQQRPYAPGDGDGRYGYWTSRRKGEPWRPIDLDDDREGFHHCPEERILQHTVFGEGEHPWPDDMELGMRPEDEGIALAFLQSEYRKSQERFAMDPTYRANDAKANELE